jgi:hypothetical protein
MNRDIFCFFSCLNLQLKYRQYKIALPELDEYQKRKLVYKVTADKMFVCPECNEVWEIATAGINTHSSERKEIHYKNFPRIGKPKKICLECKIKKEGVQNGILSTNT